MRIEANATYEDDKKRWQYLADTWHGGDVYKNGTDMYGARIILPFGDEQKEDKEYTTKYNKRVALTPVENYYKKELTRFNSYIWKNQVKRSNSNWLDINPDRVIESISLNALRLGEYWAYVDTNFNNISQKEITVQDAENLGIEKFVIPVHPASILEYNEDANGILQRVTVLNAVTRKPSPSEEQYTQYYATIWTNTEWKKYVLEDDEDWILIEENTHNNGIVPFARLESILNCVDLADLQRAIVNLESQRLLSIVNLLWPINVISGIEDEANVSLSSDATTLTIKGEGGDFKKVNADTAQVTTINDQKNSTIQTFLDLLYNDSALDKRAAESAEKKRLDREGLYSVLSTWAQKIEDFERDLAHIYTGTPQHIQYEKDSFDIDTRDDIIQQINTTDMVMPIEYTRSLMKKLVRREHDDEEARQMDKLIEEAPIITKNKSNAVAALSLDDATLEKYLGLQEGSISKGREQEDSSIQRSIPIMEAQNG